MFNEKVNICLESWTTVLLSRFQVPEGTQDSTEPPGTQEPGGSLETSACQACLVHPSEMKVMCFRGIEAETSPRVSHKPPPLAGCTAPQSALCLIGWPSSSKASRIRVGMSSQNHAPVTVTPSLGRRCVDDTSRDSVTWPGRARASSSVITTLGPSSGGQERGFFKWKDSDEIYQRRCPLSH